MKFLTQPTSIAAAVAELAQRDPVASLMRTAEWADMPLAVRKRSFFSAGVTSADFLNTAKTKLLDAVAMRREAVARGQAFVDRSSFIGDLRKLALANQLGTGANPKSLTDIASRARLALIFDMQTQFAAGFARYQVDQTPELLDAFPAQELLPSTARNPRLDWERRWIAAGGQVINGRIVGLKTDPAWERLSVFGLPYPPFDFGSQRELMDLDRSEAETLGLLSRSQRLQPATQRLNDRLQQSLTNLDPATISRLQQLLGDNIEVNGSTITYREAA